MTKHYASLSHEHRGMKASGIYVRTWWPVAGIRRLRRKHRDTTTFNHKYKSGNPLFNTAATIYHSDAALGITSLTGVKMAPVLKAGAADLRNSMDLDLHDITFLAPIIAMIAPMRQTPLQQMMKMRLY